MTSNRLRHHLPRAFTLIELVVVVIIIGVLAGIAALAYNTFVDHTRTTAIEASTTSVERAIAGKSAERDIAVEDLITQPGFGADSLGVQGATVEATDASHVKVTVQTRSACLGYNDYNSAQPSEYIYGSADSACPAVSLAASTAADNPAVRASLGDSGMDGVLAASFPGVTYNGDSAKNYEVKVTDASGNWRTQAYVPYYSGTHKFGYSSLVTDTAPYGWTVGEKIQLYILEDGVQVLGPYGTTIQP